MDKKSFGKKGELKAAEFLKNKGYSILSSNYIKRSGEIDIIAFDPKHDEYVFVEVKTRKDHYFGYPEDAVDDEKLEKIAVTAESWLAENSLDDSEWRIDIISIEWSDKHPEIEHIENVN